MNRLRILNTFMSFMIINGVELSVNVNRLRILNTFMIIKGVEIKIIEEQLRLNL